MSLFCIYRRLAPFNKVIVTLNKAGVLDWYIAARIGVVQTFAFHARRRTFSGHFRGDIYTGSPTVSIMLPLRVSCWATACYFNEEALGRSASLTRYRKEPSTWSPAYKWRLEQPFSHYLIWIGSKKTTKLSIGRNTPTNGHLGSVQEWRAAVGELSVDRCNLYVMVWWCSFVFEILIVQPYVSTFMNTSQFRLR